jgi:hypothetical protein
VSVEALALRGQPNASASSVLMRSQRDQIARRRGEHDKHLPADPCLDAPSATRRLAAPTRESLAHDIPEVRALNPVTCAQRGTERGTEGNRNIPG